METTEMMEILHRMWTNFSRDLHHEVYKTGPFLTSQWLEIICVFQRRRPLATFRPELSNYVIESELGEKRANQP